MTQPVWSVSFFWWFVVFYVLHFGVEFFLDLKNYFYVRRQYVVPQAYSHIISQDVFIKSKNYTLDKLRFGMFSAFIQMLLFWVLVLAHGFQWFDDYSAVFVTRGTLTHSVLFCLLVGLFFFVVQMPFRLYSTFVIEEKYGFNQTTLKVFCVDLIKSLVLSLVLGVSLLYVVFWLMSITGNFWWLWVWGVITFFQFFIAMVYPTLLAPLFNKFVPLEEGELKTNIEKIAHKIGFNMSGIYVIDGSRRSGHSNAYFAGLGKWRRIVLYDTLIKQLSQNELLAVLAHEMGHNVKKHVQSSMIFTTCFSLVGFYILSLLVVWPDFYLAFGLNAPSHHAALVIFSLISGTFTFFVTPLMNFISRRNEYEADAFSAWATQDHESMKNALFKLTKDNLSNLTPHSWYSFYHYSHPTTLERVNALNVVKN